MAVTSSDDGNWLAENRIGGVGTSGAAHSSATSSKQRGSNFSSRRKSCATPGLTGKVSCFDTEPAVSRGTERRDSSSVRRSLEKLRSFILPDRRVSGEQQLGGNSQGQAMDAMWQDAEERDSSEAKVIIVVPKKIRWQRRSSLEVGPSDATDRRTPHRDNTKPERHPEDAAAYNQSFWNDAHAQACFKPPAPEGWRRSLGLRRGRKSAALAVEGERSAFQFHSPWQQVRGPPGMFDLSDAASDTASTSASTHATTSPTSTFSRSELSSPHTFSPAVSMKGMYSPAVSMKGSAGHGATGEAAAEEGAHQQDQQGWMGAGWLRKKLWHPRKSEAVC